MSKATLANVNLERETLLRELEERGVQKVKVGGFDLDGIFRGKYISMEKFASALKGGFGFCDVIFGWDSSDRLYDNVRFTGWHTGYPDLVARIDPATRRYVPWENNTALFLVDFLDRQGDPLPVSPRQVLQRVIARATKLGYAPLMSAEFEFFFFREDCHSLQQKRFRDLTPLTPGMFGYSVVRASQSAEMVDEIVTLMRQYDVEIEGIHTETGPGVFECALRYDTALRAADKAALFKTGMKELAARRGLSVTFMAKSSENLPGCSGHIHQSLWDKERKENLFYDENGRYSMSKLMRHYVAGQLASMRAFMPLVAPTINSYKRTVPGTWAPTRVSWGVDNRTTALRVIPGGASTRVEYRLAGADINPHVAFAASLAGGLHGIERKLTPPDPVQASAYDTDLEPLPATLAEAVQAFAASDVAREYFGERFVEHYTAAKQWEVRQFNQAVTDWELQRYFEST